MILNLLLIEIGHEILKSYGRTLYSYGHKGSVNVTAPKNFTVNAGENVSINAGMNITSVAGQNVATSAGMNISESATLNHSSIAGGMMMQNAALDYSLMAANILEVAQGERKARAKEMKENAKSKVVSIEGDNNWETQGEYNNNSGNSSKSH